MKGLVWHALIITAVLFGGDWRFNGGRDAEALMAALRADVAGRAQLQAYHVNQAVDRQIAALLLAASR